MASKFRNRLRGVGEELNTQIGDLTRETVIVVHREVTTPTPVDTGTARARWLAGLDAPQRGPTDELSEADAAVALGSSYSQAQSTARAMRPETEQAAYISNNLPYIGRLNDGWSAQAPAGYVERAVSAAVAFVVRRAQRLRNVKVTR